MSTEEMKLSIFRQVDALDGSKLKELYGLVQNFINSQRSEEEWMGVTDYEKEGIEASLQELNEGKSIYHNDVIGKARKKYAEE